MIPKIIHYCNLSKSPLSERIKGYMETWKKHLPDYEFIEWNLNRFDIESSSWVKHAVEVGALQSAADYICLHALYEYGGIYLDANIEVLRPFDELLSLPYFIGNSASEGEDWQPATGVIAAEKGCDWVKKSLNFIYNGSLPNNSQKDVSAIIKKVIKTYYNIKILSDADAFDNSTDKFCLLPKAYFYPRQFRTVGKPQKILPFTVSMPKLTGNNRLMTLEAILNDVDVSQLMKPLSKSKNEATKSISNASITCSLLSCTSNGNCELNTCTQWGCIDQSSCWAAGCVYSQCAVYACDTFSDAPTTSPSPTPAPDYFCSSLACYSYGCESYGCMRQSCTYNACNFYACTNYGYATPIPPFPETPAPTCQTAACRYNGCNSNACLDNG